MISCLLLVKDKKVISLREIIKNGMDKAPVPIELKED